MGNAGHLLRHAGGIFQGADPSMLAPPAQRPLQTQVVMHRTIGDGQIGC